MRLVVDDWTFVEPEKRFRTSRPLPKTDCFAPTELFVSVPAMVRLFGVGLLLGGTVFGCSDDRPPFADSDGRGGTDRGGSEARPDGGGAPPLAGEAGQGSEPSLSGAGGAGEGGEDSSTAGHSGDSSPEPVVPLTGDAFSSEGVYVFGVLSKTFPSDFSAVTHLGDVRHHVVSLGSVKFGNVSFSSIGIWKGRLTYIPDSTQMLPFRGLTEFNHDGVDIGPDEYPAAPLENDVILDTPGCPAAAPSQNGPGRFLVGPDDRMIYLCGAGVGAAWYEGEERVLEGHEDLAALGREGLLVYREVGGFSVGSLGSEATSRVTELPLVTLRAKGVGASADFHTVVGYEIVGQFWLGSLDATGAYTELGRFPNVPQGVSSVALDSLDRLYVVYPADGHYEVARATLGVKGTSDGGKVEVLLKGTETSAVNPTYLFAPL